MKQKGISRNAVILIFVILALIGIYMYMRRKNGNPYLPDDRTGPDDQDGGGGGSNWTDDSFPLSKDSKGDAVETMQKMLMKIGGGRENTLPEFGADGKYGDETESALMKLGYSTVVTENVMDDIIADFQAKTKTSENGGFFSDAVDYFKF